MTHEKADRYDDVLEKETPTKRRIGRLATLESLTGWRCPTSQRVCSSRLRLGGDLISMAYQYPECRSSASI